MVTDPQIAEAAVIGVPDPDKGSRIVAFVTLKPGVAEFDPKQAGASVTRLVGKAMVPSEIIRVAGLPKTKNGKIMPRDPRTIPWRARGRHVAGCGHAARPHPGTAIGA